MNFGDTLEGIGAARECIVKISGILINNRKEKWTTKIRMEQANSTEHTGKNFE